ncbi:hypothetical protein N7523_001280 [Penicillium sp. IBT 18751x]|nr:hypothetical protein N7523_001280 [Penicillium sp. IBT 18751x]
MDTHTLGSLIPHAKRKVSRPLSAHVAPFEPSSRRVPLELMATPAEESEITEFDEIIEWPTECPESRSFTPFFEGEGVGNKATAQCSQYQQREPAREIVHVKHLESGCRQYLFSPESNLPATGPQFEQRTSPERCRKFESVNEEVELTDPTPGCHAHQGMITPSLASQIPKCRRYDHSDSHGHCTTKSLGGPAVIRESDSLFPRLTTQEDAVLTRAAERQARLWLEAERIEKDRLEMEDEMVKKRAIVQHSLEARQFSRLEREGFNCTRSEEIVHDHQRRDEATACTADCQREFDARIWETFYPFWAQQPLCARFPHTHIRARIPDNQGLVTLFENVFYNMAGYKYGYIDYRPLPVAPIRTLSRRSELPRHRPSWIPGPVPTRIDWNDPSICNNAEARREIRENACFVPYMEPYGLHRPPHLRDPCIEPLIGQETLPRIPPFVPDFSGKSLQESAWLRGFPPWAHRPLSSAQNDHTQSRNTATTRWSASIHTNLDTPRSKLDPPHAPSRMLTGSQSLYPVPESPNYSNSPLQKTARSPKLHHQAPQSPVLYRNTPSSHRTDRQTTYSALHSPNYYDNTPSPQRIRNQHTYHHGPQSPTTIDTTPSPLRRRRRPRKK